MLNITNIREIKIKTTMRHHLTSLRIATIKKTRENAFCKKKKKGKEIQKTQVLYTVGGNVNCYSYYEKQNGGSSNNGTSTGSSNLFSGYI